MNKKKLNITTKSDENADTKNKKKSKIVDDEKDDNYNNGEIKKSDSMISGSHVINGSQRKYPKHSKVLIKTISQEKNIKDSSSGDFEAIMENMYSEIEQNKALKDDSGDNNAFMSPKKIVYSPENNNNQLIDRFTQISVIRPNLNELNIEQSSDNADNADNAENEVPNEEYIYSYDPKNG